jgi:hypothetical protein
MQDAGPKTTENLRAIEPPRDVLPNQRMQLTAEPARAPRRRSAPVSRCGAKVCAGVEVIAAADARFVRLLQNEKRWQESRQASCNQR